VITAVATRLAVGFSWELAALFGAIMTVTGPTVVAPLIRAVRPTANVSGVLVWEGILVDPIGATLAVLTYQPLFKMLTEAANPALAKAQATAQIKLTVNTATCSFQGSPIAREVDFTSSCDIAKRALALSAASYETVHDASAAVAVVAVGDKTISSLNATKLTEHKFDEASAKGIAAFKKDLADALKGAGYPAKADPAGVDQVKVVGILVILVIFVTMVYGPIAAMLVELFPTRIRYTSMSLPYHIGNGWFGGLLPSITFAMVAQNGNIYYGLWYPIGVAAMSFVIGMLFVKETKDVDIYARD
jgi:hypothetical protein